MAVAPPGKAGHGLNTQAKVGGIPRSRRVGRAVSTGRPLIILTLGEQRDPVILAGYSGVLLREREPDAQGLGCYCTRTNEITIFLKRIAQEVTDKMMEAGISLSRRDVFERWVTKAVVEVVSHELLHWADMVALGPRAYLEVPDAERFVGDLAREGYLGGRGSWRLKEWMM